MAGMTFSVKPGAGRYSAPLRVPDEMKPLDMLAYAPCTLKQKFRDGVEARAFEQFRKTGRSFVCHIPLGCASSGEYDEIWKEPRVEKLPGIIISIGFGDFFRNEFRQTHIDTGHYRAVLPADVNRTFTEGGIVDPENRYTVYSGQAYHLLVDLDKLGNLPVPRTWEDILDSRYMNNVIIGGSRDELSEVLLISIYRDFGDEGLQSLAHNVKDVWHCSMMAKHAGSGSEEGAAVYVISSFFASAAPEKDNVVKVIPEEGMFMSPLYMLVKPEEAERLSPLTDYLLGEEYGSLMAEAEYPVINGKITQGGYAGEKVKWVGWDFIRNNDIFALREKLSGDFTRAIGK